MFNPRFSKSATFPQGMKVKRNGNHLRINHGWRSRYQFAVPFHRKLHCRLFSLTICVPFAPKYKGGEPRSVTDMLLTCIQTLSRSKSPNHFQAGKEKRLIDKSFYPLQTCRKNRHRIFCCSEQKAASDFKNLLKN